MAQTMTLKQQVREFWGRSSCGEVYAREDLGENRLERQARVRYELEPYLPKFAHFDEGGGRDVLEVGVGMGVDHLEWAKSRPRSLSGIDMTERAVDFTRCRLDDAGYTSNLMVADAERLPFPDNSFDLVYSWGVIHHTPNTERAVGEIFRVLRPGGTARVMIYHTQSMVGYMLWLRYSLMTGHPLQRLAQTYAEHLESPGTKAYGLDEARRMFSSFSHTDVRSQLTFADLLEGEVGQRHRGSLLSVAKRLYPRWLIRHLAPGLGLDLLIAATK